MEVIKGRRCFRRLGNPCSIRNADLKSITIDRVVMVPWKLMALSMPVSDFNLT